MLCSRAGKSGTFTRMGRNSAKGVALRPIKKRTEDVSLLLKNQG